MSNATCDRTREAAIEVPAEEAAAFQKWLLGEVEKTTAMYVEDIGRAHQWPDEPKVREARRQDLASYRIQTKDAAALLEQGLDRHNGQPVTYEGAVGELSYVANNVFMDVAEEFHEITRTAPLDFEAIRAQLGKLGWWVAECERLDQIERGEAVPA